jgi:hypothetical protein
VGYVNHAFGIVVLPPSEGFVGRCTLVIKTLVPLGASFSKIREF